MSKPRITGLSPVTKNQKLSLAGVAAVGAVALTFSLVPGNDAEAQKTQSIDAAPVAWSSTTGAQQAKDVRASVVDQHALSMNRAEAEAAALKKKAVDAQVKAKAAADAKAADVKAKAQAAAKAKAEKARAEKAAASRSADRAPTYSNNLDGWIRESLAIMKDKGIPGSYEGLHRNIMRESSGDPNVSNDWDINAQNGVPSIGLLQIIKPTFDAYHVAGTPHSQYDPVANITAAANYAGDKYGSIDNVDSAY